MWYRVLLYQNEKTKQNKNKKKQQNKIKDEFESKHDSKRRLIRASLFQELEQALATSDVMDGRTDRWIDGQSLL